MLHFRYNLCAKRNYAIVMTNAYVGSLVLHCLKKVPTFKLSVTLSNLN